MESQAPPAHYGDEDERRRIESTEAAMREQGVATETPVQVDYFGFEELHTITLPDGKSQITHQALNEGQRRKYQNALNRDVRIAKSSGDAILRIAAGEEKKELLQAAIVDWNLVKFNDRTKQIEPVPFTEKALRDFLDKANPKVIDIIEKEVRLVNSWLQSEMTVEEIDKEIETLQELREKKLEDEAKK